MRENETADCRRPAGLDLSFAGRGRPMNEITRAVVVQLPGRAPATILTPLVDNIGSLAIGPRKSILSLADLGTFGSVRQSSGGFHKWVVNAIQAELGRHHCAPQGLRLAKQSAIISTPGLVYKSSKQIACMTGTLLNNVLRAELEQSFRHVDLTRNLRLASPAG